MSLPLTLRLSLKWQLHTLLAKPTRTYRLSLGPTRPLTATMLANEPLAPNFLLNLGSKLTLCLTVPLNLRLIPLGNKHRLYNIFELSRPLNIYQPFNAGIQTVLKHLSQYTIQQMQIYHKRSKRDKVLLISMIEALLKIHQLLSLMIIHRIIDV